MDILSTTTSKEFLERLQSSVKHELTREEINQQQVSFVYSVMYGRDGMTREKAEKLVSAQHGA